MNTTDIFPRIAHILSRMTKVLAILCGILFLLYIGMVAWFYSELSARTGDITRAAGLSAHVESALHSVFMFLAALLLFNALARLAIAALNPFARTADVLPKALSVVAISFVSLYLPTGIRTLRGVDESGLRSVMEPADPVRSSWFMPDGTPALFHSIEEDGAIRFWNRPGITPDSGVTSQPVTLEIRRDWVRRKLQDDARREAERKTYLCLAKQESAAPKLPNWTPRAQPVEQRTQAEIKTPAVALPVSTSIPFWDPSYPPGDKPRNPAPRAQEAEWQTVRLRPSVFFTSRGIPGSRVEIRSDGQGAYHLPNGSGPVGFLGGTTTFHNPYGEFRLLCGQSQVLNISFRWIPQ